MIYYEYFLDENNFIKGWQQWNPERKIKNKDENKKYQEKIKSIKNNPVPLKEMNELSQKNGILYNKEKNCNYQLINNNIIEVSYIKTEKELFNEKYNDNKKLEILTKALIDPDDIEVVKYKTAIQNLKIKRIGVV